MLFDGTVTLDESNEGVVTLAVPMEAGKELAITFDDNSVTTTTMDYQGAVVAAVEMVIGGVEHEMSVASPDGASAYIEISNEGGASLAGEHTLKLVQS